MTCDARPKLNPVAELREAAAHGAYFLLFKERQIASTLHARLMMYLAAIPVAVQVIWTRFSRIGMYL
jgi:hypothetical protein